MKKITSLTLIMLLLAALVFPCALAQESGFPQNGMGPAQNANPPEPENPVSNDKGNANVGLVNVEEVRTIIAKLTDKDAVATLKTLLAAYEKALAGNDRDALQKAADALKKAVADARAMLDSANQPKPTNSEAVRAKETVPPVDAAKPNEIAPPVPTQSPANLPAPLANAQTLAEKYQNAMDVGKVEQAIAQVKDTATAKNLKALLTAYVEALDNGKEDEIQKALGALLGAIADTGLKLDDPVAIGMNNGSKGVNWQVQAVNEQPFDAERGKLLDVDKVTKAIAQVKDTAAAKKLKALLDAFVKALADGDEDEIQEALEALLEAMVEAQLNADNGTNPAGNGMITSAHAMYRRYLDVDKIKSLIYANGTGRGVLLPFQTLLTAYEQALAGEDDEALQEAYDALIEAMENAGIEV